MPQESNLLSRVLASHRLVAIFFSILTDYSIMFCKNCGNKLADSKRFCGSCGKPVSADVESDNLKDARAGAVSMGTRFINYLIDTVLGGTILVFLLLSVWGLINILSSW